MKAREVMTTKVVSVGPDLGTRKVAKMLIDNKISAVPVVDDKGSPIGMVSEGDLVSRDTPDLQAHRDWWLVLLAEGEMLDFLPGTKNVRSGDWTVAPVPEALQQRWVEITGPGDFVSKCQNLDVFGCV